MYNSKISCKEFRELYMKAYDDNKEAVHALIADGSEK